ncbi:MAG: YdgA family protein [Gallionellaceae bacterium]|nr:YdgA family protein [Gallionellaceae bacterium]
MKKIGIAFAIIFALVAAWAAAAWYNGTRLETKTADLVTRINAVWAEALTEAQMPEGSKLEIKQTSYERGIFSSHARFVIQMQMAESFGLVEEGQPVTALPIAEYDATIWHGPFPLGALQQGMILPRRFQSHGTLQGVGTFKMAMDAVLAGKPLLTLDFGCSYSRHCTGEGSTPPVNFDMRPISQNMITFGGTQAKFDLDYRSDVDYTGTFDLKLLPLTIGGQNFGSGQISAAGDAQSANETISWQTDQGASKIVVALTTNSPVSMWSSVKPEDLPTLIKTASLKLEVSKPMIIDLVARAVSLSDGMDLANAREMATAEFDEMWGSSPDAQEFVRAEGEMLISEWQYNGDTLVVNGKDHSEMLEMFKSGMRDAGQPDAPVMNEESDPDGGEAAAE